MDQGTHFAEFVLDEDALYTPLGVMPLVEITRAEFVREVVSDGAAPSTRQASVPAVAGGAVVGGAVFGVAGVVAGGLLGSTVKEDVPGAPKFRTASVKIVFETDSQTCSMEIAREQEAAANSFVKAVRKAMKRHSE